ncbi:hypothetical protein GCM10027275_09160 [Rhabdobacter roseus]|uniref:AAA+ ATPase superfamily predicted ATPase n=1 Tax=Rhabdobacter roseus TaxID=1655419 RepID=A0A840TM22_9BACT|nr:ATP-binding protein [Rhabdobacter roseus]MBB5282817.1 AAA+ ATPase superfamily predicted ATPase [Rhabdobacter roseus]
MRNRIGAPVAGDDFFGREKEIEYVWELLKDGNNILLPSPRRVGKSSFAKKMLEKAAQNGWLTIEINLEKANLEFQFIELLTDQLKTSAWDKTKEAANKLFETLSLLKPKLSMGGASVSLEWQREKANVYRELEKVLPHDKETVIFFDEVAVLLNGMLTNAGGEKRHVEELLHWLRSLRQVSNSKIRWIYCSSVGIENFTTSHQLSKTINDFKFYELKAFDLNTGKAMIQALEEGNKVELTEEVREKMLDKLGYLLPYFIQVLFEKIKGYHQLEARPINADLIDEAYESIINGAYLSTWIERLEEQYGTYKDDALVVLKHTCQAPKGVKRENLVNVLHSKHQDIDQAESILAKLLAMLKNDGYLTEENNHYLFRSPLIRDFWYNRYAR